jgi:site-specific recombinase
MVILMFAAEGAAKAASQASGWPDWLTVVLSGVLAALVSGIGHWISRDNAKLAARITRQNAILAARIEAAKKLADSRQSWINELRSDMAKLESLTIHTVMKRRKGENYDHLQLEYCELQSRIQLRLNPNDEDYAPLMEIWARFLGENEQGLLGTNAAEYSSICQKILKKEWDKLKDDLNKFQDIVDD